MVTQSRPPILVTRPQAQSDRFAAELRLRGGDDLQIVISALLAAEFVVPDLGDRPFAAVIFTSETGVQAAAALRGPLPRRAFCVGARTAQAAQAAGFDALSADGDADALVALIGRSGVAGPLVHLRGEDARGDVAERLSLAGTETVSAVCYRQAPQPLTDQAAALLRGEMPVILPLFSPRSAALCLAGYRALPGVAPLWIAAMSPAVAEVAAPAARMIVARRPDAAAMVDAVMALIDASAAG